MKVLWVGDAGVPTGFSMCTHAACDALYTMGHDVHVLGVNFYADHNPIHNTWPYPIYSCVSPWEGGKDNRGITRLRHLVISLRPDIVVLLTDPANVGSYVTYVKDHVKALEESGTLPPNFTLPLFFGWLAVDSENQGSRVEGHLDHLICWTQFAVDVLIHDGYTGPHSIVPLGVDTDLFYPMDKEVCRKQLFGDTVKPQDFLVGMIGRNQERKDLMSAVVAFRKFIQGLSPSDIREHHPFLYLHCAPTGENAYNLPEMVHHLGMKDHVLVCDQAPGYGLPSTHMKHVYSSFDVLMNTSWGEGWGLPTLEAMSCRVHTLVPNYAAFGDKGWTQGMSARIEMDDPMPVYPQQTQQGCWSFGRRIDTADCALNLDLLYRGVHQIMDEYLDYRSFAKALTWERSGRGLVEVLEEVMRVGPVVEEVEEFKEVVNV